MNSFYYLANEFIMPDDLKIKYGMVCDTLEEEVNRLFPAKKNECDIVIANGIIKGYSGSYGLVLFLEYNIDEEVGKMPLGIFDPAIHLKRYNSEFDFLIKNMGKIEDTSVKVALQYRYHSRTNLEERKLEIQRDRVPTILGFSYQG